MRYCISLGWEEAGLGAHPCTAPAGTMHPLEAPIALLLLRCQSFIIIIIITIINISGGDSMLCFKIASVVTALKSHHSY